jgi:flavin-dependent dehydrogenase
MKKQQFSGAVIACALVIMLGTAGCGTLGGGAAEVGLAGVGGALGYEVSDHKIGGAAAGAAAGYLAAKVARREVNRAETEAEKRGYERAMNQAVKQQYWIIQNQQRTDKPAVKTATMVPVVIPESNTNGVIRNESVAFVPVGP